MGLVLGRQLGESIVIFDENNPDEILATVQVYKEEKGLKLKIEAPKHIGIVRGEVYGRMEASKINNTRR